MSDIFRNPSGYSDPTAGKALSHIIHENNVQKENLQLEEMKNRKKVYVVSKYCGDTQVNVWKACNCCKYVIRHGCMPIASHLLYPQFLEDRDPLQRKLGCQFGLALLAICREVWVFTENRELSDGMRAEIAEARKLKKKVRYIDMKELKI